jgi:ABC-type sulfate/molybdate transport systems ATPase subunit
MTHIRLTHRLTHRLTRRLNRKIPPVFSLDVDFPLAAGVTALFGPPAAGKSLILDSIAGFTEPAAGRILLDDVILFDAEARVNVPPRRRRCGYITGRDALFPHLTLRQNLMFAAAGFARLERHKRVAEMLERFQLTAVIEAPPDGLTPNQKLRGAIARALAAEPKLLLIDERGVDEALLLAIRADFAGPILLVTADLELCYAAALDLLVLDAGRIVQRGPARQVMEAPDCVEAARLLGIPNLFDAEITALDPGRDSSRLRFEHFPLTGPYVPGHFRGDRVWVAVRAEDLRVHAGELTPQLNFVAADLLRTCHRTRSVRLEFSHGIVAEIPRQEYERQKDNRTWQVEFPLEALRVL